MRRWKLFRKAEPQKAEDNTLNNLRFPLAGALALAAAILCAFFWTPVVVAQAELARPERIVLRGSSRLIDETRTVALAGNTPAFVRVAADLGAVDGETRLERMLLLLKPDAGREAELDALLEAQQEPGSEEYHKWVTPGEFGARFGADDAGLKAVTAWLGSHGFTVDEVAAGRRLIAFSGTAAEVEEAFHAPLHRFQVGSGAAAVEHLANARDPEVPEALAGVVAGVVSLNDTRRGRMMREPRRLNARPEWNLGGSHFLYPGDLAAIYDVAPLYAKGTAGTGVGIAVAGRSNLVLNDVAAFRTAAGLGAGAPAVTLPSGDPGLVSGDQDEATLDVEWAGAVAPAARVTLVAEASTATTDGVDLAAAYLVNHAVAPVVSVSYGECEAEMGAAELKFYDGLWKQAAAEGMSVFVASGDAGAAGCDAGSAAKGTRAAVNGICSSIYATCVGGTEFDEGGDAGRYWAGANGAGNISALGYIPETAWNESAEDGGTGLWATGGGVSAVYAQPGWQAGVNGAAADGMRAVPDVSLTAAAHDGYVIHENGVDWITSGTSAAAPSVAAMMALVVEAQGAWQGNANAGLYALAGTGAFQRTAEGNNGVPGVSGYEATGDEFNLATGLGSVDAEALVTEWAGLTNPRAGPKPVGVRAGPVSGPALPKHRVRMD